MDNSLEFDSGSRVNVSIAKVSLLLAIRVLDDFPEEVLFILDTFGEGANDEDAEELGVDALLFINCRTVSWTIF